MKPNYTFNFSESKAQITKLIKYKLINQQSSRVRNNKPKTREPECTRRTAKCWQCEATHEAPTPRFIRQTKRVPMHANICKPWRMWQSGENGTPTVSLANATIPFSLDPFRTTEQIVKSDRTSCFDILLPVVNASDLSLFATGRLLTIFLKVCTFVDNAYDYADCSTLHTSHRKYTRCEVQQKIAPTPTIQPFF